MKATLTAVKARIQAQLTYVRDRDVFITEDENLIPNRAKFPAVGIKDGPESWNTQTADQQDWIGDVDVIAYVQLAKNEATIMGDAAASRKGVLDMVADLKTALDGYMLGGIVDVAVPADSAGSEPMGDEEEVIQKKRFTMRYKRFE